MTPFVRGELIQIEDMDTYVRDMAHGLGVPEDSVRRVVKDIQDNDAIWINDVYQVAIRNTSMEELGHSIRVLHLSIKRRDKEPIHDWRDLQEIKNQLVGPECEAIEIYPAESRLVDTSNQYHLWVFADPGYRIPLGFPDRLVYDGPGVAGAKQRPRK